MPTQVENFLDIECKALHIVGLARLASVRRKRFIPPFATDLS